MVISARYEFVILGQEILGKAGSSEVLYHQRGLFAAFLLLLWLLGPGLAIIANLGYIPDMYQCLLEVCQITSGRLTVYVMDPE